MSRNSSPLRIIELSIWDDYMSDKDSFKKWFPVKNKSGSVIGYSNPEDDLHIHRGITKSLLTYHIMVRGEIFRLTPIGKLDLWDTIKTSKLSSK